MDSVPEQGRIEELPLSRILLQLEGARFGGALSLSRERVSKRFLFQDGAPTARFVGVQPKAALLGAIQEAAAL